MFAIAQFITRIRLRVQPYLKKLAIGIFTAEVPATNILHSVGDTQSFSNVFRQRDNTFVASLVNEKSYNSSFSAITLAQTPGTAHV